MIMLLNTTDTSLKKCFKTILRQLSSLENTDSLTIHIIMTMLKEEVSFNFTSEVKMTL